MLVYGKNTLKEIEAKDIRRVFVNKNIQDKELFAYLKDNKIKYELVDNTFLSKKVNGNHQGIVIETNDYNYYNLDECFSEEFVVILDHLEDPHNFGAIIRTCEAAGIKSVIIPKDRSVRVNETVMKTSTGALSRVKVLLVSNINDAINKLKKENFFVYAADMDGKDYRKYNFDGKKCLVIGNEGSGVSNLVLKNCDEVISIPMKGKVNSLNASVAAAILIFNMNGE
ncbi:MAG: 23S rRNA (guanosine(2251)-2'-O)-methyltransferase RlmB [Firmicutes bacterium]|nr:23S rRNA (guanosine(2251)-2'-O)-methyltransferase RlmB [Bacillota bacterium]